MADKRKTMGLSPCKWGLWGKKTKESNATMPHKPRLHALGPLFLCVSAIYEYGVFIFFYFNFLLYKTCVDSSFFFLKLMLQTYVQLLLLLLSLSLILLLLLLLLLLSVMPYQLCLISPLLSILKDGNITSNLRKYTLFSCYRFCLSEKRRCACVKWDSFRHLRKDWNQTWPVTSDKHILSGIGCKIWPFLVSFIFVLNLKCANAAMVLTPSV